MSYLTQDHFDHFAEHGYVILENIFTDDEVAAAVEETLHYMPSWDELSASPLKFQELLSHGGSAGTVRNARFPFTGSMLNQLTLHPDLVALAKHVLKADRVSLEHSAVTGKYAGVDDYDQSLHVDYGNHTLAYPRDPAKDGHEHDVFVLAYYTDVTIDLGPTYVLSQQYSRGETLVPRHRPREQFPHLYEHEVPATVPAGSAVVYSINTFHRGSAMLAKQGMRLSHHIGYRAAPSQYYDPRLYMTFGGSAQMDHFLVAASPEERAMVGFPPVGDPYWTPDMVEGVAQRYPEMDMTPYEHRSGAPR